MDPATLRQLRGAAELLTTAVDAATREIAEAHQTIAHWPYAWMAQVPGLALPARAIAGVQHALTGTVYGGVRRVNHLVGRAACYTFDQLEARAAVRDL